MVFYTHSVCLSASILHVCTFLEFPLAGMVIFRDQSASINIWPQKCNVMSKWTYWTHTSSHTTCLALYVPNKCHSTQQERRLKVFPKLSFTTHKIKFLRRWRPTTYGNLFKADTINFFKKLPQKFPTIHITKSP